MRTHADKKSAKTPRILSGDGAGNYLEDNRTQPVPESKANTTGLPDNLKSGIENLSGHSLDDVNVHYNSSQPAQLNAHAYAQGNEIHLAPGQEKHLPHEAWHVVQQKQGRVKPTLQMKDKVNVNDDHSLEKEADVMGSLALQRAAVNHDIAGLLSSSAGSSEVVQRLTSAQTQAINQSIAANQAIVNLHKNIINVRRNGWRPKRRMRRFMLQELIAALTASIPARQAVQDGNAELGNADNGGGHAARIVNEEALLALAQTEVDGLVHHAAGAWAAYPPVANRERRTMARWDRDPIQYETRFVVAAADAAEGWQAVQGGRRR